MQYFPLWGLDCSNYRGLLILWGADNDVGDCSKERPEVGLEGVGRAWAAQDTQERVVGHVVEPWKGLAGGEKERKGGRK